ncbi:hypothetical protein BABINDRAFT_158904 [Babjeviella inositovora NRRL Y-12698]|uniref:Sidoreflexin n=1 Tax=Babjeviella inositovora NRRL Y-12698 TaxID=984486 RepID=A0A1E3QXK5_9ASCO|nr:uncharacterized protein BABINDRAFT_158904 [Babjeviella inositovora NRRL Y-12698]ODQ82274.1 hypothetical protein BABINDRAFT_158904 [Babjeviella inositovora NRRL Y-12698]
MASSVPGPIQLPQARYDLSTYWGRVKHCAGLTDPTMCLNTTADVENARALVSQYKNGKISHMTPELWRAKKILDSTIHPDNGETIFLPFRMCCNVISNLLITAGMLTPNMGVVGTLFWQVANQSLNVAVNTANSNKSHPMTTQQIITNYTMAVTASCSVAVGLNSIVPRLTKVSANTRMILGRLVPFAAVVSAGVVNVFLMRGEEIKKGITVFDSEGNEQGVSKTAALYAVGETAASRVINATPIMVVPPLVLVKLQKMGLMRTKSRVIQTLATCGIVAATGFVALPFAIAVFPQRESMSVDKLEPQFRRLKNPQGERIETLEFNRGI